MAEANIPSTTQTKATTSTETVKFRRSAFVIGHEGINRNVNKKGQEVKGEVKDSELVGFSEPLQKQYTEFLTNYLTNLQTAVHKDSTVLQSSEHVYDRKFIAELTDLNGNPDGAKITAFLKRPEGWMATTQLLENQISMKLWALGLVAEKLPQGQKKVAGEEMNIHLNINRGDLNRLFLDRLAPHIPAVALATLEAALVTNGAVWGAAIDSVIYGHLGDLATAAIIQSGVVGGLIAGAPVPAAILAYKGIRSLTNNGVMINLKNSAIAFEIIKNNPHEAAYMKAVYGIDVNDFSNNAGKVELVQGIEHYTDNVDQIQNDIIQQMYARNEFYTTLQIPLDQIDALPEQGVLKWSPDSMEHTSVKYKKRLLEVFKPNNGGIQDNTHISPGHTGFDATSLDVAGNLKRFHDARRQVLVETMKDYVDKVKENREEGKAMQTIKDKKNSRGENGKLRLKTVKEHTDKKALYDSDKQRTEAGKKTVKDYKELLEELQKSRSALEEALRKSFGGSISDVDTALNTLDRVLDTSGSNIKIGSQTIISMYDRNESLLMAIEKDHVDGVTALAPIVNESAEQYQKRIDGVDQLVQLRHKKEILDLTRDQKIIDDLRTDLLKFKKTIEANQKALNPSEPAATEMDKTFLALRTDQATITALGGGTLITNTLLTTETIDQIMARINTYHSTHPTEGWDEAQNKEPEYRQQVSNAIMEAKALALEASDTSRTSVRTVEYTAMTKAITAGGWGISPEIIRSMTEPQLLKIIHDLHSTSGGTMGWPDTADTAVNLLALRNVVAEANSIVDKRLKVMEDTIKEHEKLSKEEDRSAKAVNFDKETDHLELVLTLMEHQGDIFSRCSEVAANTGPLVDITAIDTTPTNTLNSKNEKELFVGVPLTKGYLEMMNLLFDYRGREDADEYFGKISKFLPPDKLAKIMHDFMGYGSTIAGYNDFAIASNNLKGRFTTNTFDAPELQQMTVNFINRYRDEALKMS